MRQGNEKNKTEKEALARKGRRFLRNLKANWFLPISSLTLGCVAFSDTPVFWLSLVFAALIVAAFAGVSEPLVSWAAKCSISVRIIALLSSLGICWRSQQYAYSTWISTCPVLDLSPGLVFDGALAISLVLTVGSFAVVYLGTVFVWSVVADVAVSALSQARCSAVEYTVYAILCILFLHFAGSAFMTSYAYYSGTFDVIYTGDSPFPNMYSPYFDWTSGENDIRSPLFTAFASPFLGIAYLISTLFHLSVPATAVLLNSVQLMMLLFSYFLLGGAMNLRGTERICWMIFCCSTYATCLFSVMMEQYIISLFWLSAAIFQICRKGVADACVAWGAAGTTITSIILLPAVSRHPLKEDLRSWAKDLARHGLAFLSLVLAFFRFDVLYNFSSRMAFLLTFSGQQVPWREKLLQYLAFPASCFVARPSDIVTDAAWLKLNAVSYFGDGAAWRLNNASEFNWSGYAILILVGASILLNWQQTSTRIAAVWVLLSIVVLLLFGWGTAENGLNLYALYFGWAFFMLFFLLLQKTGNSLRWTWFLPTACLVISVALLAVNVPAMQAMHTFAVEHYPV